MLMLAVLLLVVQGYVINHIAGIDYRAGRLAPPRLECRRPLSSVG